MPCWLGRDGSVLTGLAAPPSDETRVVVLLPRGSKLNSFGMVSCFSDRCGV